MSRRIIVQYEVSQQTPVIRAYSEFSKRCNAANTVKNFRKNMEHVPFAVARRKRKLEAAKKIRRINMMMNRSSRRRFI